MKSSDSFSPIGKLLVGEGFVVQEDIQRAYEIRDENMKMAALPLGLILVREGHLLKEDLNLLIAHGEIQHKIETTLIESSMIRKEELEKCLYPDHGIKKPNSALVREGLVTDTGLKQLVHKLIDGSTLGKLAVRLNKITEKHLEDALEIKKYNKSIGEILFDMNLITLTELNHVFRKHNTELKLGTILLQQELIESNRLEEALREQKEEVVYLGEILIRKKMVTINQLYFALSIQYNTPFQALKGFMFSEKQEAELREIVKQRYAEENRIIPLFLNGTNLTLAVSNPSNMKAMYRLMSIYTHLNIKCVLITEEKFEQLYAILFGETLASSTASRLNQSALGPASLEKTVITDPGEELGIGLMDDLYEEYVRLLEEMGQRRSGSDKEMFYNLIMEHHGIMCCEHNCKGVEFWFETTENWIQIKASPLLTRVIASEFF